MHMHAENHTKHRILILLLDLCHARIAIYVFTAAVNKLSIVHYQHLNMRRYSRMP